MSDVFTIIMLLSPFCLMMFFLIQSRIGDEQKRERHQFAEANPHLEAYLRRTPAYQDYYSTRPPVEKVKHAGGMTDEQKKSSLRKCGPDILHA